MKRIGIMGGTFDPVHLGHLNIADQAYREYQLDEVWFMPSRIPPHKHGRRITSAEDRVAMVEAAISPYPWFVCSDYELRREGGNTYTADTIRLLKQDYPDVEFYFIVGEDSVRHIESWYHPEYILKEIPLLAAQREDEETLGPETDELTPLIKNLEEKYGARIGVLHCAEMDISSAEIRAKIESGEDVDKLLPPSVIDIIRTRHLYKDS